MGDWEKDGGLGRRMMDWVGGWGRRGREEYEGLKTMEDWKG